MHPSSDPLQADNGTVPPVPSRPAPTQLRLDENPEQMLQRARAAVLALRSRRPRYGENVRDVFALVALYTWADGIARVSAAQLARDLELEKTNVCRALRTLAAAGWVQPMERVDGEFVPATRHPSHRAGYLVPRMVAPTWSAGRARPHLVRGSDHR